MDTRLRERSPAATGSQDAGSRNLVFTFYPTAVFASNHAFSLDIIYYQKC